MIVLPTAFNDAYSSALPALKPFLSHFKVINVLGAHISGFLRMGMAKIIVRFLEDHYILPSVAHGGR